MKRLQETLLKPTTATVENLADILKTGELKQPTSLADLLKRPELRYEHITQIAPPIEMLPPTVQEQVEIQIKYDGYIQRQQRKIHQFKRLENFRIPETFDYANVQGLKTEATRKTYKDPSGLYRASVSTARRFASRYFNLDGYPSSTESEIIWDRTSTFY